MKTAVFIPALTKPGKFTAQTKAYGCRDAVHGHTHICAQTGTGNFFRTFLAVFYRFHSYSVTLVPSFESPFPPVPRASVVIHVVKKRFPTKKTGSVFTFISWLIQRNTVSYLRCCHPYRRTIHNQRDNFGSEQSHRTRRVNASCRQCS